MPTHVTIEVPNIGKLEVPTGLFIDNQWVESASGETFPTINPATGKHFLDFAHAKKEDVDRAVKSSRKAFKEVWGNNVAATERAALLFRFADLLERDAAKIAALESLNSGKGVRIAREFDVGDSVAALRYFAGLADKSCGQTLNHFGKEKFVYTLHQPIGVCGQIIPWNYPLMMWAWKVGPALAAGCTVVMKPSELTPLTDLAMCDLAKEAGIPAGVINTLPGLGSTTGDAISRHMDIDKVAFTGSVITGRRISIAAAESNLKKVTLELGGKSPSIIFDSANVEEAASWIAMGIWFNSGQDCCASSRLYVQDGVYDQFIETLTAKAKACAIGQPSDETTSFGPLISETQRDKVLSYIEAGRSEGARVVTGGQKYSASGFDGGYWVKPTILADTNINMKVVQEEIFGPVIVVSKFKDEKEVVELANNTIYGLAASVFTNDANQQTRLAQQIDAGTIWLNQYGILHPNVPFGGFKHSGIGRELGTYGLEAYQQVKAVHQNLTQKISWPL